MDMLKRTKILVAFLAVTVLCASIGFAAAGDTLKVSGSWAFNASSNLMTIYVSNKFVTTKHKSSYNMFSNCNSLAGGAGTKFDSTKTDKSYARIDVEDTAPGYFTAKSSATK